MENGVPDIKQSPILLTGAARSGTSLIAGVINTCGAYGGLMSGNSTFENGRIRSVVEDYLKQINCDPRGQSVLPDTMNIPIPSDWKRRINKIILEDGYKEGAWFYKGSKTVLTWPLWHYAYPNAKWVIVRRRSADIAKSCLHTSYMNAYSTHDEWVQWINEHEKKFVEMIHAGCNVKVIWPERLVRGDHEQLYELIEWLGLPWRPQEVINFIDPKLWKARVTEKIRI